MRSQKRIAMSAILAGPPVGIAVLATIGQPHSTKLSTFTEPAMSGWGPGCVKTCASSECAELFSPLSSFDYNCQYCSFPIQYNRDKISTCKFDVGVFTQPGSISDLGARNLDVGFTPTSRHRQPDSVRLTLRADFFTTALKEIG